MSRKITGIVTSDKADKTIQITLTSRLTHPLYGKQYTRSRKFAAHDEKNEAKMGDRVEIEEVRPISRTKSFKLVKVIQRGHEQVAIKEEPAAEAPVKEETK
ncbi:30S ribosomal protein S17 [Candidatus Saccharibacteria bacterium]|nr:30S ribosomal protein S17 [Candidatus Saccharibacteria bacterium]